MEHPMNSVQCNGCQAVLEPCTGCPQRIEICHECRQIPKKLKRARQKMELHIRRHQLVQYQTKILTKRRAVSVPEA